MFSIEFPIKCDEIFHKNYNVYYRYVMSLFKEGGCVIKMVPHTSFNNYSKRAFELKINNDLIAIDFSDHLEVSIPDKFINIYKVIFKFHYCKRLHSGIKNMRALSPISFYDWSIYRNFLEKIKYNASGQIVSRQLPYAGALQRRTNIQSMLKNKYGSRFENNLIKQDLFYLDINNILVSVCVPGARNNMLDKGQGQYMAFGCCTISPKLLTTMSWQHDIIQDFHYIRCADDYSDLFEKIKWVEDNKQSAIEIGRNAKDLFAETSLPEKQMAWVKKCLYND